MDISKNSNKIRIVVISHALVNSFNQNRWKKLAKDPEYEVHLLVPEHWEQTWFEEKVTYTPSETHENDFHVHPIPTTSDNNWVNYFFISLDIKLGSLKPDVIYIIHEETIWVHHQIYLYKKIFSPKSKILFFSMNAKGMELKRIHNRCRWENIRRNTDAAIVHYPGCRDSLRDMGYEKPIYLQTQIGVDETFFRPNVKKRQEYRIRLGLENKFVIGYVGRLAEAKGVDDIFAVYTELSQEIDFIDLLLVGNGDLMGKIKTEIQEQNLEKRVHLTGFVDQSVVPYYMNAMDLFVLGSKTMPDWIDTFPLVTVQAQSCGIPVVASDSGSIPWQLDGTARIFPEGNRQILKEQILEFINNEDMRETYAKKGRMRCLEYFCHRGMTENFKKIVSQIMNDNVAYHSEDEMYKQWKAY